VHLNSNVGVPANAMLQFSFQRGSKSALSKDYAVIFQGMDSSVVLEINETLFLPVKLHKEKDIIQVTSGYIILFLALTEHFVSGEDWQTCTFYQGVFWRKAVVHVVRLRYN